MPKVTYLVVVRDSGYEAEMVGGLSKVKAQTLALSITSLLQDYGHQPALNNEAGVRVWVLPEDGND